MSILAAILILGASGSAERSMDTDETIAGIVSQVAWGTVSDAALSRQADGRFEPGRMGRLFTRDAPRLTIDGQSREGLRAWGEAAWRIGGYVVDAPSDGRLPRWTVEGRERDHSGSEIGLAYRLRIRGYDIATSTTVSDGRVVKVIDAWWTEHVRVGRQTKRIPVHVQIIIRATETEGTVHGSKTVLAGTATGLAETSDFRCGLVRRLAERQAAEQLDVGLRNALAAIERRGRSAYASGDGIADVLDEIELGIKIGQRIGRR